MKPISERISNAKHRLFIDELFRNNQNATRAYMAVYGCSYDAARINASKLLTNANISEEIERRLKQSAMSANEVIARLAEHAKAEYTEYIDDTGHVDIARMKEDGKGHLIQGTKWDRDGRLVVEFPNSQTALVHLGKFHSLFTDKVEHSGSVESKLVVLPAQDASD